MTKKDIQTIIQVLKKYPEVEIAVLYGSRALGTYQRGSDIDIALKGSHLTSSICSHIHFELEEETLLPYFFDITDYQRIKNKKLKEHIDRVGKVIYGIDSGKLREENSTLPRGWVETTLGEVATFQRGFDLPKKNRIRGKYPLMVSNGQDGTHKEFKVKAPGVVTGRSGTLGQVYYVKDDFWPLNTTLWIKDFHKNDVKFVYYFLKEIPFERYNAGSGVPTLNRNHIHPISISSPPLPEQKAIAGVLSSLDAKIDLLQQQNQSLEKIAQTLFKQWFVEFNFPDENGKPYKDNDGEMVGSALGEIPKDWGGKTIEDIVLNLDNKRIPLSSRQRADKEGKYPYYGASGIVDFIDEYIFEGDHILFSEDGENLRSRKQPIVFLVDDKFWVNNHAHILRGKKEFYFYYIYLFLSSIDISHIITGAVQPKINKTNLHSLELVFPDDTVVIKFDRIVTPLFNKIKNNKKQIETLTEIRDAILPKLMSGKIRVSEEYEL
ncbi:MAG: restriction endonuclease subunit S [Deltaproteobacteria bacterium]|nr:restriction endonuclease subunit S [Deltaproteobacteria bacterium]